MIKETVFSGSEAFIVKFTIKIQWRWEEINEEEIFLSAWKFNCLSFCQKDVIF